MPNVPVPDAVRDDLRLSNMVVWEAKRTKKGEPIQLTLAGPGLPNMLYGWGMTIEDAVQSARNSVLHLREQSNLRGALARLEWAVADLRWVVANCGKNGGVYDDDDIPF